MPKTHQPLETSFVFPPDSNVTAVAPLPDGAAVMISRRRPDRLSLPRLYFNDPIVAAGAEPNAVKL